MYLLIDSFKNIIQFNSTLKYIELYFNFYLKIIDEQQFPSD